MITVFTPTYNRAHTLGRLYESLIRQTSKDFEWIIVDDGSTDDSKSIICKWIKERKILIRYYYQHNSGKPQAHNKGVELANGELFCCVDSDDYLSDDAIKRISDVWKKKRDNNIGILAFRYNIDGEPITSIKNCVPKSTLHEAYKYHGLKGDTMLVYDMGILKKYKFPMIEGEKFIPEGYLYNKLDKEGTLIILPEGLYICDYQSDGYTANVDKLIFNNWKGYVLHLKSRIKNVDTLKEKFFDSIRYDAICIAHSEKKYISKSDYRLLAILAVIPGFVLYRKRYYPLIKNVKK